MGTSDWWLGIPYYKWAWITILWVVPTVYILGAAGAYMWKRNGERRRLMHKHANQLRDQVVESGLKITIPDPSTLDKSFDETFARRQYIFPLAATALASFAGLLALLGGFSYADSMGIAYIAATIYVVNIVYRRYIEFDLKPAVLSFASMRIFVAMALAFVADIAMRAFAFDQTGGSGGHWQAIAIGFLAGVTPDSLLRFLRADFSKRVKMAQQAETDQFPLTMLQGCSPFDESRLMEEGIENAQSLATADVVQLVASMPCSVQKLIDWIDQAVLYIHSTPEAIRGFRGAGIRSVSDLFDVLEHYGTSGDDKLEHAASRVSDATKDVDGNAAVSASRVMTIYLSARREPNLPLVRQFWKGTRVHALVNMRQQGLRHPSNAVPPPALPAQGDGPSAE